MLPVRRQQLLYIKTCFGPRITVDALYVHTIRFHLPPVSSQGRFYVSEQLFWLALNLETSGHQLGSVYK